MEDIDQLLVEQYLNPEKKLFTPKLIAKYMTNIIVYIFFKIIGIAAVIAGLVIIFYDIIMNLKEGYVPILMLFGIMAFIAGITLMFISKLGAPAARFELSCANKHYAKAFGMAVRTVGAKAAGDIASRASGSDLPNLASEVYGAVSGYEIRRQTILGTIEELNKAGVNTSYKKGSFLSVLYTTVAIVGVSAIILMIIFVITHLMGTMGSKITFITIASCFGTFGVISLIDQILYVTFLIIYRRKLKKADKTA
ncbi:MAG: hypothetical protein K6A63_03810 [Acholeplasmatales bacterium]|nr:hypothetical protein [Acholeplasmatales bacterium]